MDNLAVLIGGNAILKYLRAEVKHDSYVSAGKHDRLSDEVVIRVNLALEILPDPQPELGIGLIPVADEVLHNRAGDTVLVEHVIHVQRVLGLLLLRAAVERGTLDRLSNLGGQGSPQPGVALNISRSVESVDIPAAVVQRSVSVDVRVSGVEVV